MSPFRVTCYLAKPIQPKRLVSPGRYAGNFERVRFFSLLYFNQIFFNMKLLWVEMACLLGIQNKIQGKVAPKISTVFVSEDSECFFLCSEKSFLASLFLMSSKFVQIKEQGIEEFFSSKMFYNHSLFDYKMVLVCVIGTLFFDGSTLVRASSTQIRSILGSGTRF